jgi:hypothetical protein
MLIDRIGMATCIACFQNGLLYIALPIVGSTLFGFNGMWAGFAVAPPVAISVTMFFVRQRFGKENFPFLLKGLEADVVVMDGALTPESAVTLSIEVKDSLHAHGYSGATAAKARLFIEEICVTILDMNGPRKKPILIELSLFFEIDSVLIIIRDSGKLFDLTDSDSQVEGLSGFILSGLMEAHQEKAYLVTTGYNRNMIRFPK